jgi:hypothetical protein
MTAARSESLPLRDDGSDRPCAPRTGHPLQPKPYLSVEELAQLTPWSGQAIRTMMSRGILCEGVHYFHVRRRPVFKWEAIVAFIERRDVESPAVPLLRGGVLGGATKA